MPPDDVLPTDDELAVALRHAAARVQTEDPGALGRAVAAGRARRRRRRSLGGVAAALVLVGGLAIGVAATGDDEGATDLQVGTPDTTQPVPPTTMTTTPEGAVVLEFGPVDDVDLELFGDEWYVLARTAEEECSPTARPAVLPTVGATERHVLSTSGLIQAWTAAGPGSTRAWLTDPALQPTGPVAIIAPMPPGAIPDPGPSDDDSFLREVVAVGTAWLRCTPSDPVLEIPFVVEGIGLPRADGPPRPLDGLNGVPDLPLYDDERPAVEGPTPREPGVLADGGLFSGDVPFMGMSVERAWCGDIAPPYDTSGLEVSWPTEMTVPGSGTSNSRPMVFVPWDEPITELPRIQVLSSTWEPDVRPLPGSLGAQRATLEIACGGRSSPLHLLAVQVTGDGGWNVWWSAPDPPPLPDGGPNDPPPNVIPPPAWREDG